jgi:FkbH-like protein
MKFLDYLVESRKLVTAKREDFGATVSINLITNFTDTILQQALVGVALSQNVYPDVHVVPYKQYHLHLKDPKSDLRRRSADITFIFFDVNPFKDSEFLSRAHFEEVLADIEQYVKDSKGMVVVNSFIASYQSAYGNLVAENPKFALIHEYNKKLDALSATNPNVTVFDTNRLVHILGESNAFDLRGIYAFDIPFTNDFMALMAEEWFAYIRALIGGVKKCIVLDLDNTLWGGVVGELGPLGIALGPDYPGNAFVNFQRALLDFCNRGIILAINSKNNPADVAEAFEKNHYFVLGEKNFSAIRTNWDDKIANMKSIAEELNIGLDSMVFIDDDPLHRAMVAAALPEVTVPDWSMPPEEYTRALYGLNLFHQFSLTDEDREKGRMYAEERQRKNVRERAVDVNDYIASLGITMTISMNDETLSPRLAQMTQKTNQFNLTTQRYGEHDIRKFLADDNLAFSGKVDDKFGDYGTVILAIVKNGAGVGLKKDEAALDSFLMSCRVMGRGIECAFIDHVIRELHAREVKKLHAKFIPTAKNDPAKNFLHEHGFSQTPKGNDDYILDIETYIAHPCEKVNKAIIITP